MSYRLQLEVSHLSLRRRHLVNAYKVKAGICVFAGKTVQSMSALSVSYRQKERYINPLNFYLFYLYLQRRRKALNVTNTVGCQK